MKVRLLVLTAGMLALEIAAQAEIKLPSAIADNMVLQRESNVKLWGKATPGAQVRVMPSWTKSMSTAVAASDSTWLVKVETPQAGGPYSIEFAEGKEKQTVSNVLIGEVWFCSGQSNMEMPMKGFVSQPVDGAAATVSEAKKSTPIRMFITDSDRGRWIRQHSKTPRIDIQGRWCENVPENVAETSATAYYFAQKLQSALDVPVGIIISTLGGSNIESWLPEDVLASELPDKDFSILHNNEPIKAPQATPCVLWNGKINPLTNYGVRGFLWYQGEANRTRANEYSRLMAAFVSTLRDRFADGEPLPFYYVEIAPYDYNNGDNIEAALLREAQADALDLIDNCAMASTIDIGNPTVIHPSHKSAVGQRLALLALTHTYDMKGIDADSPRYKSMEIEGNKAYINVNNARNGLNPMAKDLDGFEIAGEDGKFVPAKAIIASDNRRLAVWSDEVPQPQHVRYAFRNTPKASVYNAWGLPLLPFRTDR